MEENLSLFALGTLEPDSAREVESHLASGCPSCGDLLRQYQGTTVMLPYALAAKTPPAELKAGILRAITGRSEPAEIPEAAATLQLPPIIPAAPSAKVDIPSAPAGWTPTYESPQTTPDVPEPLPSQMRRTPSSRPDRPARRPMALAASLAGLLLGVGGFAYYLFATLEAERTAYVEDRMAFAKAMLKASDLERQLDERQRDLSKANSELNRAIQALRTTHELLAKHQEQIETLQASRPGKSTEEMARLLSSPTARMADLHGTDMAKNAYALVFVEPELRRGFFYANNLPALPAGKTYQLWVITEKPISVALFSLDRGRKGRVLLQGMPDVSRIQKFAVSMEPAGGRPQPTGSIYLIGDM